MHADPAPFVVTQIERLPANSVGTVEAWSPTGDQILYSGPDHALYLFDLQQRQSTVLVQDFSTITDSEHQIVTTWDNTHNAIIYARHQSDTTLDIVAINPAGTELRTFVTDVPAGYHVWDFNEYPANPPHSLAFRYSVSSNGRIGVLQDDRILSMRVEEADQEIMLAPAAVRQLTALAPYDYYRLWLASDGIHYALAITQTLSLYAAGHNSALFTLSFHSEHPQASRAQRLVDELSWSPDSQAIYYRVIDTGNGVGSYFSGIYAHHIGDSEPQEVGSYWTEAGTWSPDSQWILMHQTGGAHCSPNCEETQIIADPFGARTTILWSDQWPISQAQWAPDGQRFAQTCVESYERPIGPPKLCVITLQKEPL